MEKEIVEMFRFVRCRENLKRVGDDCNLLETIWRYYTIHCSIKDDSVQKMMQSLQPTLSTLSQKKRRVFMARVVELCVEHERAAFIEGLRVGGRLLLELEEGGDELMEEVRRMFI